MKSYEVYSYGMITSSTLYILERDFPSADHYAEICKTIKMIGGEAANSSIVASKLGLKVKLDGNWIADDSDGAFTKSILKKYKINIDSLKFKKSSLVPKELVFSSKEKRTIFGNYTAVLSKQRKWNFPSKTDIERARIVCLDPFFKAESLQVAKYADQLHIPYITIDCKYTDQILEKAAITIISSEFRNRFYSNQSKKIIFDKYKKRSKGLIILTEGDKPIMFGRKGEKLKIVHPVKIKPIDTAGAGDSFRAGMIYGMLQNWDDKKAIIFSSALASLVCQSFPGVLDCPTYREVINFIKKHH